MQSPSRGYSCFDLVEVGKKDHLCCVRNCRKHRAKGRRVCYNHHITAWRINNPLKAAFATLRDHAKRRNVIFTLTLDQFEAIVIPSGYLDHKGNTKEDLHLDRIDPLRGYEYDNLQILTCSENSAKGATKDKQAYVDEKIAKYNMTKAQESHQDYHLHRFYSDDYCPF